MNPLPRGAFLVRAARGKGAGQGEVREQDFGSWGLFEEKEPAQRQKLETQGRQSGQTEGTGAGPEELKGCPGPWRCTIRKGLLGASLFPGLFPLEGRELAPPEAQCPATPCSELSPPPSPCLVRRARDSEQRHQETRTRAGHEAPPVLPSPPFSHPHSPGLLQTLPGCGPALGLLARTPPWKRSLLGCFLLRD